MKFLDALRGPQVTRNDLSFQDWIDLFQQSVYQSGGQWPGYQMTYGKDPAEPIANNFAGYIAGGLQSNGVIFALELKRLQVFSQARFQYQRMRNGRPGDLFGDMSLTVLERPWPAATTGDLLGRMIVDADFAGNSWMAPLDGEIVRLRPDWVEVILRPRMMPSGGPDGEDVQVGFTQIGIYYYEGGIYSGVKPAVFLAGEYSHFAPIPDPLATYRGMSWLTPVIRELQADTSATKHKLKFFEHAATPNVAVSLPKEITPEQFAAFVEKMDASHRGVDNAYKTLYTGGGADVTVIGANMQQLDFKVTQGAGETRLAAAAGIHPVIVGLSEGMQGSSLNAGNYTAAKRNTVDTTFRHLWQNAAGSLEPLVSVPDGSRLWYDARDIPFLHEDQKDVAEIQQAQASAWRQLVDGGMDPDAATAFLTTNDLSALLGKHNGLYSVQLQPPTDQQQGANPGPKGPAVPAARSSGSPARPSRVRRSSGADGWDTDPIGELDEDTEALIFALFRYAPKVTRALEGAAFNAKHKRGPDGKFLKIVDRVIGALDEHKRAGGKGDPLKDFDREQLRQAAKARGIPLKRGEDRDSIAAKLLADIGNAKHVAPPKAPPAKAAKDDLDKLDDRDLRDLAAEFGINHDGKTRAQLLAAIRRKKKAQEAAKAPSLLERVVPAGVKHLNEKDLHALAAELGVKHEDPAALRDIVAIKLQRELDAKAGKPAKAAAKALPPIPEMAKLDKMPEAKLRKLARDHGIPEAGVNRWDLAIDIRKKARAHEAAIEAAAKKEQFANLDKMDTGDLFGLGHKHGIDAPNRSELIVALKMELAPQGPGDPAKYHISMKGLEDLQKAVETGAVVNENRFAQGAIGDTRKRKYADGTELVWKRGTKFGEQDAEQLASITARALGLRAPRIYRNRAEEVNMEFMPGQLGIDHPAVRRQEWMHLAEGVPDSLAATKEGRMMGLLDQLIANTDRHNGNWLIEKDGHIHPIDHGYAFGNRPGSPLKNGAKPDLIRSGFGQHYYDEWGNGWGPNDLTKADIAEIRQRLEKLQPDFEKLGREKWHRFMMQRLAAIGQHAKGTQSRLLPSLVE